MNLPGRSGSDDAANDADVAEVANVAALIPAYREAGRIGPVIRGALAVVRTVLVVDDGSGDGTAGAAREAGAEVLLHPVNRGKGAAIKTGLAALAPQQVDWIVLLDGDGQHAPGEITRFMAARNTQRRALVIGNRMEDTRAMPPVRYWVNRLMSEAISRICQQPIPDSQCGFRMVPREAVEVLLACPSDRFDYESEMLFAASRAGFRIESVPISTIYAGEQSKIHPARDTIRFLRLLWRHRGGRG